MSQIGIALATYRPHPQFLREQLQSLVAQTEKNWICVVSDDTPEPGVAELVERFTDRDPRFKYQKNPNPPGVRNNFSAALTALLLKNPQIEFFFCCDQDDIWVPEKIQTLVEILQTQPEVSAVHSDLSLIDAAGNHIQDSCWQKEHRENLDGKDLLHLLVRNQVTGCAMALRRSLLQQSVPMPRDGLFLHDHWLAVQAAARKQLAIFPRPLVKYRQHAGNVIGAAQMRQRSIWAKLLRLSKAIANSRTAFQDMQLLTAHLEASLNSHGIAVENKQAFRILREGRSWVLGRRFLSAPNLWTKKVWLQACLGCILR